MRMYSYILHQVDHVFYYYLILLNSLFYKNYTFNIYF